MMVASGVKLQIYWNMIQGARGLQLRSRLPLWSNPSVRGELGARSFRLALPFLAATLARVGEVWGP